jgi:glycosyltransferase involved in cell wall biosynthesis
MKIDIKLSFCIPTYNNSNSLFRLVNDILSFDSLQIEVVVLNNGSSDNTLEILHNINDDRLSIFDNGINKGALFNMVNVLDKGEGEYLVYITDHDHVDSKKINQFIKFFIENPNISFGYCDYKQSETRSYKIFHKGYEALSNLAYITRHPTGYFFKRKFWKDIKSVERFSDYNFVDLFPLEFVFADLSLLGDGAIYSDNIFSPETGIRVVEHKSATTKGNSKTAFFTPECRLKLALSFRKHIQTLKITTSQKNNLILDSFYRELNYSVFNYRYILNNEKLCIHYHMDRREIGKFEMIGIAIRFIKKYYKNINTKKSLLLFFTSLVVIKPRSFFGLIYHILFI